MKHVRRPTTRSTATSAGRCAYCKLAYASGDEIVRHHGQNAHAACYRLRRAVFVALQEDEARALSAPVGEQAFNVLVAPVGKDKFEEKD